MPEDSSIEKNFVVPVDNPTGDTVFWQSLACLLVMMLMASVEAAASKSGGPLVGTLVSFEPSNWKVLTTLAGVLVLVFLTLRSVRDTRLLDTVMSLATIFGLTFGVDALLGPTAGTIAFCLVVVVYYSDPWVVIYDLLLCLGLAGISSSVGPVFQPGALLLVLVLFAIYDVTAVHLSERSVLFGHRLPRRRAFFSFVLPFSWSGLRTGIGKVSGNVGGFGFRGIGDLLLPTMFVISVLWHHGLAAAGSGMLGAVLFSVLSHMSFPRSLSSQVLPPLALGSVIGYLTFFLVV